jgi:ABC-type transport system involved in multi-copper enzyme maturation permease subunit
MSDFYLFRSALRDLTRPKRIIVALVLIALPTLLAMLFRFGMSAEEYSGEAVYNTLESGVVFGFLLVILSVVFGTGVLAQEIEQKTIVYLLTRPVPRWRIMLMKFLGAAVSIIVTVWLSSLMLAVVAFGPTGITKESTASVVATTDITDLQGLYTKLKEGKDSLSSYLQSQLSNSNFLMSQDKLPADQLENLRKPLTDDLNAVARSEEPLYDQERFAGVNLSEKTRAIIVKNPTGRERAHLNRLLLQEAYPNEIAPLQTPLKLLLKDLAILPVGALAYGAVFLLLATLLNRPLMYGLIFAFGWESWVPTMPGNFQKVSLMSYLRVLAPHPQLDTDTASLSSLLSAFNPSTITATLAWQVLLGVIVVAVAMALFIFSKNEYAPREDAE